MQTGGNDGQLSCALKPGFPACASGRRGRGLSRNRRPCRGAPASLPFTLKQVGPGVYAAIDGPKGTSGANAGFVIGDDGVLVVDSFFNPDATRALVGEIGKLTDKPIRYVVNTHYHIDHVAGDGVLKKAGRHHHRPSQCARLGAQRKLSSSRQAADTRIPRPDRCGAAARHHDPHGDDHLAGRAQDRDPAGAGAHRRRSDGRACPMRRFVFCGDILWNHVSPNIIDGNVARWIAEAHALRADPAAAQTTFVPGHGDIATAKDVGDFETYLSDLRALVRRERAAGLSGAALVKAALPVFAKEHGDWRAFGHFAPLQLRFMEEELAGTKRVPKPAED